VSAIRREYSFEMIWVARSKTSGHEVEYSQVIHLPDREQAVRAHKRACEGGWVTATQKRASVGPLVEWHVPDDEDRPSMSRRTAAGTIRPAMFFDYDRETSDV
jgi:hypothetical protein